MPGDNSNQEISHGKIRVSWENPLETRPDKSPLHKQAEERPSGSTSTSDTAQKDKERAEHGIAAIRGQLEEKPHEPGKDQAEYMEKVRAFRKEYDESRNLALKIFNERFLEAHGQRPLTVKDTEQSDKFSLAAKFQDQETGQKWEIVLDRKPEDPDADPLFLAHMGVRGARVSIWDNNKRGNRVTKEWTDKEYAYWSQKGESAALNASCQRSPGTRPRSGSMSRKTSL
jgi:hypothetical protein